MHHFLHNCRYSNPFWKSFELYYFANRPVHLNLKDIVIGILLPECPLLNYLILVVKVYLGSCRKNEALSNTYSYKATLKFNFETDKYINLY